MRYTFQRAENSEKTSQRKENTMNRKFGFAFALAGTLLVVPGVVLAHGGHRRHDDPGKGVRLATDIVNLVNAALTPVRPVVVAPAPVVVTPPPPPPRRVYVTPPPPPPRRVYVTPPPPPRHHYRGAPPRHHGGHHRGGHRR